MDKNGDNNQDSVIVVVRAYNEAAVIHKVISELREAFENIVVVDDGSNDGTAEALQGLNVSLIRHAVNLGGGAALQTGLTYALSRGAEWILTFDADGQHRVSDAVAILDALRARQSDVVFGSRFLGSAEHIPLTRKVLLRAATWFSNLTSKTRLTDTHNGLRGFNRRAAAVLGITQNGMAYASEILSQLARARMRIQEIPVTINYSEYSLRKGQSSLNAVNIVIDLILGRLMR